MELTFLVVTALWVMNGPPRSAPKSWTLIPLASIGQAGSGTELNEVRDIVVDQTGTAYVLDKSAPFLRIITSAGRLVNSVGRQGGGPGEFQGPRRIGWRADTLWISDPALGRVTFMDLGGRLLKTVPFRVETAPPIAGAEAAAFLPDGTVLASAVAVSRDVGLGRVTSIPLLLVTRPGKIVRTVVAADLQVRPMLLQALLNGRSGRLTIAQPFNDDPLIQVARDGSSIMVVTRRPASRWLAPTFGVTRLSNQGDTLFSRLFRYTPRNLDDSLLQQAISRIRNQPHPPSIRIDIPEETLRNEMYRPEDLPPVEDVVIAYDGAIWLRRETDTRINSVLYVILGLDGNQIGEVAVPNSEKIVAVTNATVWTSLISEDGTPILSAYRIKK